MTDKITAVDIKFELMKYYRFKRGWLTVDEFQGWDIVADTGKYIIETEIKISKSDLFNGEKKKVLGYYKYNIIEPIEKQAAWKHNRYKNPNPRHPNKFYLCIPETLKTSAIEFVQQTNTKYGIIVYYSNAREPIVVFKSAKKLHSFYESDLRYKIAKRASSALVNEMALRLHR